MKGSGGGTAMLVASREGHPEVVSLLLAAPGIKVNLANIFGETPLYKASGEGHSEVVSLLLGTPGVRVLRRNQAGQSAMELAHGHPDVLQMLEEVVDVKRTFGALLLAFLHCGLSRSEAAGLAMRGLRDGGARDMAARMRDTWPLDVGGPPGARGGEGDEEKETTKSKTAPPSIP